MALMHAKADLNSFSFLSRVPGEFGNNCGNIQSNNSQHFSQLQRPATASTKCCYVTRPWKILRFSAKLHRQTVKNVPSTRIPWDGFADSCTNCEVVHWSERLRGACERYAVSNELSTFRGHAQLYLHLLDLFIFSTHYLLGVAPLCLRSADKRSLKDYKIKIRRKKTFFIKKFSARCFRCATAPTILNVRSEGNDFFHRIDARRAIHLRPVHQPEKYFQMNLIKMIRSSRTLVDSIKHTQLCLAPAHFLRIIANQRSA